MSFLEHYKADEFALAFSFRQIFTYAGITIIPLLLDMTQREYGLNGAFLILGGFGWNCVVAGVLMKPPMRFIWREPEATDSLNIIESRLRDTRIHSTEKEEAHIPTTSRLATTDNERYKSSDSKEDVVPWSSFFTIVKTHKQIAVYTIVHALFSYFFAVWAIFLVPYGSWKGLQEGFPVLLSTVGGIGGVVGQLMVLFIVYHGKMNILVSSLFPSVVFGCGLVGYIFSERFFGMVISSLLSGYALAFADAALNSTMPVFLCSKHKREGTVASYLVSGVAMQIGGIVSGTLVDYTGSFSMVFGLMLLTAVFIPPLSVILYYMGPVDPSCCDNPTTKMS